jgi:hypothetical protein
LAGETWTENKAEKQLFDSIRAQDDLFAKQVTSNYNPCPYNFKYRYSFAAEWQVEDP